MSDLDDFEAVWKTMSQVRLDDSTSIAKSETPSGGKAPRKRKPAVAK
jgi:hypothetical protein